MIRNEYDELGFKTCEDVADYMMKFDLNRRDFLTEGIISVIGHYEYITYIIESLIRKGNIISEIELTSSMMDNYDDEYICYLVDGEVSCEKLRRENGKPSRYAEMGDLTLIHIDAKFDVLEYTDGAVTIFYVDEFDKEDYFELPDELTTDEEIEKSLSKSDIEEIDEDTRNIEIKDDGKSISYDYISKDGTRKVHTSYSSSEKLSDSFIKEFYKMILDI